MQKIVRFSPPAISQAEIDAVVDTLKSGWLTSGPKAAAFEKEFAQHVGSRHAVAVNSATAGLMLSLAVLGIGRGDKVATSVMTFTATLEAIMACGAEPVLVDIDPVTLNLDITALEKLVESVPGIRAVIPVHYGGNACPMDAIEAICRPRHIAIIEDAAHAFPTRCGKRMIGTIGDMTVFSFYANKTLTTGEGGMVTTDDAVQAERMRRMRLHGIRAASKAGPDQRALSWQYDVEERGMKCNLSDVAAAMGRVQLARAGALHERRIAIARHYHAMLAGLPLELPQAGGNFEDSSWHLFVVKLQLDRTGLTRNQLAERLLDKGIETSVHYKPIHMHSFWAAELSLQRGAFPAAEHAYEQILSLPIHPMLSDDDLRRIATGMASLFAAA